MDGQLRYHWGADQEIMTIINKRDKSPAISELVTRQIELAKPGAMRPHWNNNLGREIYVPTRPEENKKREINGSISNSKVKRVNHTFAAAISETLATKYRKEQNKMKKHIETPNQLLKQQRRDCGNTRTRSLPRNTGTGIPRRPNRGNSSTLRKYVGINLVVKTKVKRNKQQEDNVRPAELAIMLDLETLIKETAADPELIQVNCCLEDNNTNTIPNEYRTVAKKLTHR